MKKNWRLIAIPLLVLVSWMTSGDGGGVLPSPFPNPSPVDVDSPAVLVVWEQNDSGELKGDQADIISSFRTRSVFYEIVDDAGGESRTYDDDTNIDNLAEPWKEMMQLERDKLPWIVIATPSGGTEQALPDTEDEMTSLLEKYL